MPTVAWIGPYRFFFYSNERGEPRHVYVQREGHLAKFWLESVTLTGSAGFAPHELREIQRLVNDSLDQLREAWDEFFGTTD